jgi:hypothetical protein
MMAGAIRRVVFSFLLRALSVLGLAGVVGIATQANANVERERAALEKRLESAREALRGPAQDAVLDPRDEGAIGHVAQQVKRRAWNNWPNWNNWANWSNR